MNQAVTPKLYSIADARTILGGLGRTWIYDQIKAGKLRPIKLGKRTLIPATELERFIAEAAGKEAA